MWQNFYYYVGRQIFFNTCRNSCDLLNIIDSRLLNLYVKQLLNIVTIKALSYYGRQKRQIAPFGSIMVFFMREFKSSDTSHYLLRGSVWHITTNICKSGPKTAYEMYANNPELWMYLHSKTNVLVYFSSTLTQRWPRWAGAHLGTRIGVRIPWDAVVHVFD